MKFKLPPRMAVWSLWALWWLVVGTAFTWLLVGSVAYWVKHGWLPADVEGWVQAIGSIGAISVAAWAALHTADNHNRAALEAQRERVVIVRRALYEVARRGKASSEMLLTYVEGPDSGPSSRYGFLAEELDSEWRRAREIKITDMPNPELITPLLQMVFNLGRGSALARELAEWGVVGNAVEKAELLDRNLAMFMEIFGE